MGPELWEGLHGGQDGDGEQLALDVGEDTRGEGLVEDPVLEDVEELRIRGMGWGWGSTPNSLVKVSRAWGVSAMEGSLRCAGGST